MDTRQYYYRPPGIWVGKFEATGDGSYAGVFASTSGDNGAGDNGVSFRVVLLAVS